MTFEEHKETTAADCENVSKQLLELAGTVRSGNLKAFERFWLEGGTEEGDSKIIALREMLVLRYLCREEKVEQETKK